MANSEVTQAGLFDQPPPEQSETVTHSGLFDQPDPNAPPTPNYWDVNRFQPAQNPSRMSELVRSQEAIYGAPGDIASAVGQDVSEGTAALTRAPDSSDYNFGRTWQDPRSFSGAMHDVGNIVPLYGQLPEGIKNRVSGAAQILNSPGQIVREGLAHTIDAGAHAAASLANPKEASLQVLDSAQHPYPNSEAGKGQPYGMHAGSQIAADIIGLALAGRSTAGTINELAGHTGAAEATRMPFTPKTVKSVVPSEEDLEKAWRPQYKEIDELGAKVDPTKTMDMIKDIRERLSKRFVRSSPKAQSTHAALDELEERAKTGDLAFHHIDQARRQIQSEHDTEPFASRIAIGGIDDHTIHADKLFDLSPITDPIKAQRVAELLPMARGNYAAYAREHTLGNIADYARHMAEQDTPVSEAKTIQRGLNRLTDPRHPENLRGYSNEEKAALQQARQGSWPRKLGSFLGNWAPGMEQGKMPANLLHVVHTALSPITGIAAMAPLKGGELITDWAKRRAFERAREVVRANSPLGREMAANTPPNLTPWAQVPNSVLTTTANDLAHRMATGNAGDTNAGQ